MRLISRVAICLAVLAVVAPAAQSQQQAPVKIRFTLDWIPGSTHAPFLIALYNGYYKSEGLDVTIDRGKGSAEVVRQLATGVYDIGFPDINILMDFNSKNPDRAMQEVMMGHDRAAASIVALKSSGITDLKQLVGKTIGAAANDSTFKLFPILARKNGFDPTSVKVQNIEPSLRETLLARRSVDAIPAQVFNAVLELKAKGVRPEDVSYFMYNTSGLDIYGNGVAVARDFMKNNPEAVRGFIRATIKGARDMVRNPEAAVQAAVKFEPLLNPDIERDRLKLALECCILTPNVKANGYGAIDVARLKLAIDEITEGYGLPRKPTVEEMYNPTFLPPQQDRMLQ